MYNISRDQNPPPPLNKCIDWLRIHHAHVHDSCSACDNMLLLLAHISWYVTFGLHRALEHLQ